MSTISISVSGASISVRSPYLPAFVSDAKKLGGRWAAPSWVFDVRDEQRVRDLCMEHYGEGGRPAALDCVTLRMVISGEVYEGQDALRVGGRAIASASGRDSGARLGAGIVLLEGGFTSGGSVKNWCTQTKKAGATFLMRDVPRVMADRLMGAEKPSWINSITIEPEAPVIDVPVLQAEREALVARLAAIDATLQAAAAFSAGSAA